MQRKAKSLPGPYLGMVICGGSFWHYGQTPEDAALKAAQQAKRDLRDLGRLQKSSPPRTWTVNVYDVKGATEWTLSHYEMVLTMADGTEKEVGVESHHEVVA
jgi:hypothetical protein